MDWFLWLQNRAPFLPSSLGGLKNEPPLFYYRYWRWRANYLKTRDVSLLKKTEHGVTRHVWLCCKQRDTDLFVSKNRFWLKKDFFEGARCKIESFDVSTDSKGVCFTIIRKVCVSHFIAKHMSDRVKQRTWSKTCKFWITRDESSSTIVSSGEGKRTERFPEKSSGYRDSLKSEVRLPRD